VALVFWQWEPVSRVCRKAIRVFRGFRGAEMNNEERKLRIKIYNFERENTLLKRDVIKLLEENLKITRTAATYQRELQECIKTS
jgi:hypothetical protein